MNKRMYTHFCKETLVIGTLILFVGAGVSVISGDLTIDYQDGWPIYVGTGQFTGFTSSASYADIDMDGDIEIVVGRQTGDIHAWHHDGTPVTGWPVTAGASIMSAPAIGDINNDDFPEVIVSSNDGYLYAIDYHGTNLEGWPILVDSTERGYVQGSAALADVDDDGILDIIYNSYANQQTIVLNYLGEIIPGWPQAFFGTESCASTPAVADLDNDGSVEIIVGVYGLDPYMGNYNKLYVWHADGTLMDGWPQILCGEHLATIIADSVIGDIDGDGSLDIVTGDTHFLYALDQHGNMLDGFPYYFGCSCGGWGLALANFDSDVNLEIVRTRSHQLYLFDDDGTVFTGFPISFPAWCPEGGVNIADIDNDGNNEIVMGWGYNYDSLYAYEDNGTVVDGFPLTTSSPIYTAPIILDIDNDGDLEIGVGDYADDPHYYYVWDLPYMINPDKMEWPMFQHDQRNTGCYGLPSENHAPNNPLKPSGRIWGVEDRIYSYSTSTTDIDGDQIYYMWDWGDGQLSEWLGPFASGETASASHAWSNPGHYYIRVKAKDVYGAESDWSESQHVVMRRFGLQPILADPEIPD